MDIFILMRKNFGSRHFYYGYYWFNGVSWSIEENFEQWPQLIHQISQKNLKFLKLTKKRRHGPSATYSRTIRIDRKISQMTLDVSTTIWDHSLVVHGLSVSWPRTVQHMSHGLSVCAMCMWDHQGWDIKSHPSLYFKFGLIWMDIFKIFILVNGPNGHVLWKY
jgi:hypothetical protein